MQDKLPYTQHLFAISVSNLRTLFCHKNYFYTFFVTKRIYAHFFCREHGLRVFFVAETIYAFFCRENDLRTSSGKFLRVESCHPENSDFLGLCLHVVNFLPSQPESSQS